jgi:hypothetical protein
VFNIKNIEYRENAKYSTKNNKSEEVEVFLATKNQRRASTISRSILIAIATKRYIIWLEDFFFKPRSKTKRDKSTIAENIRVNAAISPN